jgi:D-alanine-D-alanine ligase
MAGKRVAVLMGGRSAERETSLRSGRACAAALERQGYRVTRIDVGRDIATLLHTLRPEAAVNLLHGGHGADGVIQGMLEMLAIPYTHSGVLASALAMRKDLSELIFRAAQIPVADGLGTSRPDAAKVGQDLACAVVGDKALGVARILQTLASDNCKGQPTPGGSTHVLPAPVSPAVYEETRRHALAAHRALGCRGVSRVDFRYHDSVDGVGGLVCLQVQAHPEMAETSLLPELAAHAGIPFGDLVKWMVEDASLNR